MAVPSRVVATAATIGGVGGFLLGFSLKDRSILDWIFPNVRAQLKDELQSRSSPNSSVLPFNKLPDSVIQGPPPPPTNLSVGPHRVSEIMKHGFPTTDHLRSRSDYVLAYDTRNRTALWVAEHLTPERLKDRTRVSRKLSEFKEDLSVHPYFRSTNEDYRTTGFDRGHLAAAGNHCINQESLNETFYLSNISPQVGTGFNRDAWNKLEQYVRFKTKSSLNVFIMTGPLYLPQMMEDGKSYVKYQVVGRNNVAVPTHFFKALLCQAANGDYHLESFVMPNKPIEENVPLQAFQVPLDAIERAAGFLLFEGLSRSAIKTANGVLPPR